MSLFTLQTNFTSHFDKAKYLFAWRISVCCTIVFAILLSVFGLNTGVNHEFVLMGFSLVTSLGIVVYLSFNDNYIPIFWVYVICGVIFPHATLHMTAGLTHLKEFIWIIAGVILAYSGLGRKQGVAILIVNAIGIVYFYLFKLNDQIATIKPRIINLLIGDIFEICFGLFCIAYLLHQYIRFNELLRSEVNEANVGLQKQNNENIVLLKEVHHRVKNNLQIITSLLRLQKSELKNINEEHLFNEAINRIMTMSLIHQKLYQEGNLSQINVTTYLEELSQDINKIHGTNNGVDIVVNSSLDNIDIKTLIPLGLLLNELISNSFKHHFKFNPKGKIDINITPKLDDTFEMTYTDYGVWNEVNMDDKGFGVELIETLTDQLDGTVHREESAYIFLLKHLD